MTLSPFLRRDGYEYTVGYEIENNHFTVKYHTSNRFTVRDNHFTVNYENSKVIEGYYRFPDLTQQCLFLGKTIWEALRTEMFNELLFL